MRDLYTAYLNIACGALIGAAIVIATIRILPTRETSKSEGDSLILKRRTCMIVLSLYNMHVLYLDPPRTERINHEPPPILTSHLFNSPLPKEKLTTTSEGQEGKEGWDMAEECDSPRRGASFDDLVELKNGDLLAQIGTCSENKILVVGVAGGTGSGIVTFI